MLRHIWPKRQNVISGAPSFAVRIRHESFTSVRKSIFDIPNEHILRKTLRDFNLNILMTKNWSKIEKYFGNV